ncbi:hypothetical protein ABI59_10765 [Acidobacteria bacterium Mor1]|nr:hypothetical protein ABI59_10765 [Acidobacteria bacterium Mor1]
MVFVLGALAALAWYLPAAKPAAAFGRLSYLQFGLACGLTLLALVVAIGALLPARARRGYGFRATAILFSITLVLGFWEAACWLMPPLHLMDNPWYLGTGQALESDPDLPYARPGGISWTGLSRGDLAMFNQDQDPYARTITFETDADGFRNSQPVPDPEVVFIGDSFTEAGNLPIEETFPHLIAEQLGKRGRNLGRAGYSPPTELIVLKRHGIDPAPDLILWQIAESNDLNEARDYRGWIQQGKPPFIKQDREGSLTRKESWQLRSPTFKLFAPLRSRRPWEQGPEGTMLGADGERYPMRMLFMPEANLAPPNHPGFGESVNALVEGKALADAAGARLLVFMLPMKFRAVAPSVTFNEFSVPRLENIGLREADGWDPPRRNRFGTWLAEACRQNGIPFVDMTEELRQGAAAGEIVYQPFDTHLAPEGHERVTRRLVAEARALLASPPAATTRPSGE